MSLAVSLGLVGLAVLVGLALHGWWTVRRARPRLPDFVGSEDRVEPAWTPSQPPQPPALADEPSLEPARIPVVRRAHRLDALIDAIVPMFLDEPVSGELALAHLPHSRRAGSKPMMIEGLNVQTQEWEHPLTGQMYREFQAGVQLAHRGGALNEIEYSEFVQKAQSFAEGVGSVGDFPDMLEVVARARELDEFAGPLDAQITMTLRANSTAWSVAYLQQCAATLGFVPGALPGRLVLPASEEGDPPVLIISFDSQAALADEGLASPLREAVLSLDVAQTPETVEPFGTWYQSGTELAKMLDATPLDDVGRPITLGAYDAIAAQLATLYRALESRDLAAGSPAARRLFS
ncbi:MAG: hypothetical protein RI949_1251 [Pseudomonadota bacterium]|jgi:hypothetical protein|nr:cell division protein FtsZ [Betaproteobacteria bacterium]